MLFPRLKKGEVLLRIRENRIFIRQDSPENGDRQGDRRKEMIENYIRSVKVVQERELGGEISEEEIRNSAPVQKFMKVMGL